MATSVMIKGCTTQNRTEIEVHSVASQQTFGVDYWLLRRDREGVEKTPSNTL